MLQAKEQRWHGLDIGDGNEWLAILPLRVSSDIETAATTKTKARTATASATNSSSSSSSSLPLKRQQQQPPQRQQQHDGAVGAPMIIMTIRNARDHVTSKTWPVSGVVLLLLLPISQYHCF
jgi:hypothetical protein